MNPPSYILVDGLFVDIGQCYGYLSDQWQHLITVLTYDGQRYTTSIALCRFYFLGRHD